MPQGLIVKNTHYITGALHVVVFFRKHSNLSLLFFVSLHQQYKVKNMSRLTMGHLLYNGEQTSQESASTNKRPTSNIAPVRNADCHGGSQAWDTRESAVNVICEACTEFWVQEAKSELDKCRTDLKKPAIYVASCLGGCTFSVTLLIVILLLLEF